MKKFLNIIIYFIVLIDKLIHLIIKRLEKIVKLILRKLIKKYI